MSALRFLILFLFAFQLMHAKKLREGHYRGVLLLDEAANIELPFNMEVQYKGKRPLIIIRNGDEKIVVDEIKVKGDSVSFKMPVFDTEFKTLFTKEGLEGVWINNYRTTQNRIRFKAVYGEQRRFLFEEGLPDPAFEGEWEVTFSPGTAQSGKALGVFHHQEQSNFVTGTFLTETGDYRYLDGMKNGNMLYLSCFDGSHAYLFTAELNEGTITNGKFYSASHWVENWEAKRNPDFKLREAGQITSATSPQEKIDFSFPNAEKKTISLSDKKYEGKPVIVQLMGSWCPNCMDESRYLSFVYNKYKSEGLEIIALAFEKTNDFDRAVAQVSRLKSRFDITYEILITQQTGKDQAAKVLPWLSGVTAFPTTVFLDKDHKISYIHTGFSGPATGKAYEDFKKDTESRINNLLKP